MLPNPSPADGIVLSRMCMRVEAASLLAGVQGARGDMAIVHLQYADDTIPFLAEGDRIPVMVRFFLELLQEVTGLKVNFDKSLLIGMNIEENTMRKATTVLGCRGAASLYLI
ncbi:hypothetical protein Taro_041732 [Colocasia esculenta]|uniref:Reverse transcriptase domain-containing protein n=1 Tax=Colocasia esculenta TaxID=4460 RepID=A0A843WUF3_COLES|nr:hypothetical protein [Colocasia esculenta]